MASSASEAPVGVAKLCPNCEKAQFRDDIPQLYQSGPHLDFDQEQLPASKRRGSGGMVDTEFEFRDLFPGLPMLRESSENGCDFCRFLYDVIMSSVVLQKYINGVSGWVVAIEISYTWGALYADGGVQRPIGKFYECSSGLDTMRIAVWLSSVETEHESFYQQICHVESACGEYLLHSSPPLYTSKSWCTLTAIRLGCSLSVVTS